MKKTLPWIAASAFIMLALPFLTVKLIRSDAALAICLLLFFAVNPLFSAAAGVFSGMDIKKRAALPFVAPVLFIAGAWLLFDPGETAFLLYAAIYLVLGYAAALIAALIKKVTTSG